MKGLFSRKDHPSGAFDNKPVTNHGRLTYGYNALYFDSTGLIETAILNIEKYLKNRKIVGNSESTVYLIEAIELLEESLL